MHTHLLNNEFGVSKGKQMPKRQQHSFYLSIDQLPKLAYTIYPNTNIVHHEIPRCHQQMVLNIDVIQHNWMLIYLMTDFGVDSDTGNIISMVGHDSHQLLRESMVQGHSLLVVQESVCKYTGDRKKKTNLKCNRFREVFLMILRID